MEPWEAPCAPSIWKYNRQSTVVMAGLYVYYYWSVTNRTAYTARTLLADMPCLAASGRRLVKWIMNKD